MKKTIAEQVQEQFKSLRFHVNKLKRLAKASGAQFKAEAIWKDEEDTRQTVRVRQHWSD